jgi:hypothetical protein
VCLLGALAVFDSDGLTTSRRRIVWGGIALGCAATIKVWAAFPAVAVLAVLLVGRRPGSARRFLTGAIAGFAVPVLPFAAIAPRAFLRDVLGAQVHRVDVSSVRMMVRLDHLLGLDYLSLGLRGILVAAAVIAGVVLFSTVVASLISRSWPPSIEWFALIATGVTGVAFAVPTDFFPHYAAFFAPFLALSIGLSIARLVSVCSATAVHRPRWRRAVGYLAPVVAGLAAVALVWMAVKGKHREAQLHALNPAPGLEHQVPAGACVLTDNPSFTVAANRFISDVPGCSPMVDSLATNLALGDGRNALSGAGRYPAVQSAWMDAFRHAQYVYLSCGPPRASACFMFTNRRIPWTDTVWRYFKGHFARLPVSIGYLYARRSALPRRSAHLSAGSLTARYTDTPSTR